MKVYRGTIARNKGRKGAAAKSAATGSLMYFFTILVIGGVLIAGIGAFGMCYMSLVQQERNLDAQIRETEKQIAETQRDLQTLVNEYARLSRFEHIRSKIRQFNLPLTLAHHSQIKSKNMEILTPLQASRVTYPRQTPVAVAGNLPARRTYSGRY